MTEMGTLRTTVGVENVSQKGGIRELPETMVDTGSEFTYAIVHAGGTATADDVVFGEENDFVLLGVRSLEGLNLRLDVVRKKLVDAGPVLAVALTSS